MRLSILLVWLVWWVRLVLLNLLIRLGVLVLLGLLVFQVLLVSLLSCGSHHRSVHRHLRHHIMMFVLG